MLGNCYLTYFIYGIQLLVKSVIANNNQIGKRKKLPVSQMQQYFLTNNGLVIANNSLWSIAQYLSRRPHIHFEALPETERALAEEDGDTRLWWSLICGSLVELAIDMFIQCYFQDKSKTRKHVFTNYKQAFTFLGICELVRYVNAFGMK